MKIKVENLGIIAEGEIELEKNKINIKYGINGSGKSTVSRGIELFVKDEELNKLRTYGSEIEPTVSISEDISSVIVFNQDYVDNYLFKD
ncbi:MAG: AAA family ATPase, partial [Erysipelotrichaceae bacterium]